MTQLGPSTATDSTKDQPCPGCGATTVRRITGISPKVQAWSCTACGMDWAISVVNPHLRPTYPANLAAAAEEIGRLRWTLHRVVELAYNASTITDQQLRHRLLALTESVR